MTWWHDKPVPTVSEMAFSCLEEFSYGLSLNSGTGCMNISSTRDFIRAIPYYLVGTTWKFSQLSELVGVPFILGCRPGWKSTNVLIFRSF